MPKQSEPIGDLHEAPQRFLETDEFQEMLQTYAKLSPMAGEKKTFESQLAQYDFQRIYPLLDLYLKSHDLTTPEKISQTVQEAAPEGYGLFVYAGPSLPHGRLKEHAVFNGTFEDVKAYLADVLEDYPQAERLIVPVERLSTFAAKVKTPGNIAHKYYNDIVSTMRGNKEV